MLRHTKIVATLGPASSSPDILERMVQAGIDVVRMNFSHGTADDHKARAEGIRAPLPSMAALSASWATCRGRRSGSASSRAARSRWSSAKPSFSMRSVRSAIRNASASTTRICPKTWSAATFCCSTMVD
jgi:hypothetical protein